MDVASVDRWADAGAVRSRGAACIAVVFLCCGALVAPGFAAPARGAEVLAYLELPEDAPPQDVARIVDAIRLVGGELLDLATGPPFRPRTTFLAAVSEPAFVALSAAAGIGPFPVSYTNVLGGEGFVHLVNGERCRPWIEPVRQCLLPAWIVAAEGMGRADFGQAAEDVGGRVEAGGEVEAIALVPAQRLSDLRADPRVGGLFLFTPAPGDHLVPFRPEETYPTELPLGEGHRFQGGASSTSKRLPEGPSPFLSRLGKKILVSVNGGAFWLLEPGNPEIFVKVVDGCAFNGHHWLFVSGLTDLGFRVFVIDFERQEHIVVESEEGVPFAPVFDVEAFSCS